MDDATDGDHVPVPGGTLLVERVARVLAGWTISRNGDGSETSAGPTVDQDWPDFVEPAIAVLKTMREPDPAVAAIGDSMLWTRMIEAAIAARVRIDLPGDPFRPLPHVRDAGVVAGTRARSDRLSDESFPASDPQPVSPGAD